MLLFAGLGNPGAKYKNNRHNVGFMVVEAIANRHSFSSWSKQFRSLICAGNIAGEKIIIIKPQTFMNLSGQSAGEVMRFYELTPSTMTVFYDDLDLAVGKVRVKVGGSVGGHNGIRSLDRHIGNDYRRVRIGIDHPGTKEMVNNHVLSDFTNADRKRLKVLLDIIGDNANLLAKGDDNGFMNKITVGLRDKPQPTDADDTTPSKTPRLQTPKAQSYICQERPNQPAVKVSETDPMDAMLKRPLGKG